MTISTRFAPSPTGDLHLGNAYAAAFAWGIARTSGGRFVVRIENIDTVRSNQAYIERNLDDLRWLGLNWDGPPLLQSLRMELYQAAVAQLDSLGVIYPCFCTRKDIRSEVHRAGGAPHAGEGPVYPGTCKLLAPSVRADFVAAGKMVALRLDTARALAITGPLTWEDIGRGVQTVDMNSLGDIVIARKGMPTSYHLSVVIDDAKQEIGLVTRGSDLFEATHVHRLLQALLGCPVPRWQHHGLVCDPEGRRMTKRAGALTIRSLREKGCSPQEVLGMAQTFLRAVSA